MLASFELNVAAEFNVPSTAVLSITHYVISNVYRSITDYVPSHAVLSVAVVP